MSIVLISIGILILLFSLWSEIKLAKHLQISQLKKRWFINMSLIFILILMNFALIYVFHLKNKDINLLTGLILFLGSIFIFINTKNMNFLIKRLNILNQSLQSSVEEKSFELIQSQEQLIQAGKMSALGEMVGQITHEINTPLGALILTNQIMQKRVHKIENEKIKKDLEKNICQINNITEQINNIIKSLKRIFSGKDVKEVKGSSISELLNDLSWLFGERARRYGIDFKIINQTPDNFKVFCRSSEIIQVINNLLNNAFDEVKGSKEAFIHLKITQEENFFYFRVIDSGVGVPEDLKEKIFETLFTTKDKGVGTGLGLGISQKIAQNHQGDLYLEEAKHTTFTLKLPIT